MPNIKSAIKRVKTSNERNAHNSAIKSAMRSAIKKVDALVLNNDADNAKTALVEANSKIDKAAQSGLVHKNTAARYKSRLAKSVNGLTA
ncbi:30S ribosomal protein S20 [Metabacillus halosaccharovorans]|uniref:Small ribosomal subunit protein bS20 n=1 Tax=Metabacillus halosaccharovorans TaxID=930124 RepID=A0ABT3DDK9_9BACI|nr:MULTISPECIES: 30S ribosomal protein S20 [Metabacillus]MCM3442058.1 30S ribosomal protein S20 [Metabacillus halosaccharovorans]MCV9884918.1 30S ribosomal protein S20 [Metabacillus halosaccharovorans]